MPLIIYLFLVDNGSFFSKKKGIIELGINDSFLLYLSMHLYEHSLSLHFYQWSLCMSHTDQIQANRSNRIVQNYFFLFQITHFYFPSEIKNIFPNVLYYYFEFFFHDRSYWSANWNISDCYWHLSRTQLFHGRLVPARIVLWFHLNKNNDLWSLSLQ